MNPQKKKTLIALRKARTLLSVVERMVQKDEYCIDIMQQTLASIGLLKGVHAKLMEGHLDSCFINAMRARNSQQKERMIKEILTVSKLANK
ncbi:MAG: metal-sensing transcriptional repressor [Candidatus Peribacteraceae bacterium]|jgi:DNA-binding FrmR family transcriptional regulator